MTGPLLSDKAFFTTCLSDEPGMAAVREAAGNGDYPAARRAFASAIRKNLKGDVYARIEHGNAGNYHFRGECAVEAADGICANEIVVCGIPHKFEGPIDWFANPTYNTYKEWTWQLSRHNEWYNLAQAYRQTGDEKYARCFADQFTGWVRQAVCPGDDVSGNETFCWRTIECGIRMSGSWPLALHRFYKSAAFTDDMLVDWYKSVWEHGVRLRRQHRSGGNWLIMEMNGLAHIGILYPQLLNAGSWYEYAINKLTEELDRQVYPDGFQIELTPGYHGTILHNYRHLMILMNAYERTFPDIFVKKLEEAAELYVKLMRGDGTLPNVNDSGNGYAADGIRIVADLFPENRVFKWVLSGGNEGTTPDYDSVALPYSGFFVMRSGWRRDDLWALFDAGPFGAGHQHEDKLNLLLYAGGNHVLTDGGNYAYDDSEMRRYVLSTRAHNTMRPDGMDQNRHKNYRWHDEDISIPAGMNYRIDDDVDTAEGEYNEGYGPGVDASIIHRRRVVFIKKPPAGLSPFFLVIDRFLSGGVHEHRYDLLWHFEDKPVEVTMGSVATEGLTLLHSVPNSGLTLVRGQKKPEWQGWIADSALQDDFRPIHTLIHTVLGGNRRVVTLLYPCPRGTCPVMAVEAGDAVEDTDITIRYPGEPSFRLEW
jgi:hypothetical protein